jgi:hypothetical protein|uniref:Uncharacterized protein n=1 Tax=Zea mays TaxID=4577 RepID=A0A804RB18_MAIZE
MTDPPVLVSSIPLLQSEAAKPGFHSDPIPTPTDLLRKQKTETEQAATYAAGDDDSSNDGHEGEVGDPRLALDGHDVREDGGKEGRGGADGLVEGDGEVAQRDVPGDDGAAEDEAERGDLGELDAGAHELHGHDAQPGDGGVGEQGAGGHVAHGEEDGVLEAVVAEEVLVEQEHADVGGVPGRD